jgi:hypothetical protein
MKVKVMGIEVSYGIHPVEPAKLESALRGWLNDNPSANIEHVVQTPVAGPYGGTSSLLTTIFYRD